MGDITPQFDRKHSLHVPYVHMQQTTFTPTEARKNFFNILRIVEKGAIVTITKPSALVKFKVSRLLETGKKDKIAIAREMKSIGFPVQPWNKMKKIINSRYENRLL